MNQFTFKNKELLLIALLGVLVIGLMTFQSRNTIPSNKQSIFEQTLSYNGSYPEIPKTYQRFIEEEPIDTILNSEEAVFEKINSLKHDAYFHQNELYREVIFIKKLNSKESYSEPIRLDVYPANRKDHQRKYLTYYKINSILYSHNNANYLLARQILPNIEINKIVPYTKSWQTAVLEIDNSILLKKKGNLIKKDSLFKNDSVIPERNTITPAYGLLFEKELQANGIPYLPIDDVLIKSDTSQRNALLKTYTRSKRIELLNIRDDLSFWESVTRFNELPDLDFINTNELETKGKLQLLMSKKLTFAQVFDIEKLATYYALLNLYSNRSDNTLYLNFNEKTSLLEPFYVKKDLGQFNMYVKDLKIQDLDFLNSYAKQLLRCAELSRTNELLVHHAIEIKKILEFAHQIEPTNFFDKELFVHNKLIIEKTLNPSTISKIGLLKYDENQMEFEVENLSNFPIEIVQLSYKEKKFINGPTEENLIIMPSENRKVVFNLPDSYDNLFVQKKKKTTGFVFEKDIFDLAIGYRFTGASDLKYDEITPFTDFDEVALTDDLFRSEIDLSLFKFVKVDEENKLIHIASDSVVLTKPLVFPAGYMVIAKAGLHIDIRAGGKIISKSSLSFKGSEEKPIKIFSSDKKGQGIFVVSAKETSELNYVEFDNLTNQTHGLWDLTGAVVFYESPVNLNHVLIANNSCEDGLNIIRTQFAMRNTTFRNTQSDAFDGDFVQGTLTNCTFENLGNDAIDVSGSSLEMYDLKITKAGDKALSAGEDSQMKAERILIDQSEIAIAGKDLSVVQINDATITNSKLGFTAFQKKPEFGASRIEARNVKMMQVETLHLIESKSSLLLNGEQVVTIEQVKEQMYGVEFGVDSKETRVKKTQ